MSDESCVEGLDVSVYTIPTDAQEADRTPARDSTSLVGGRAHTRGGTAALGYAFGDTATGTLVRDLLAGVVWDTKARTPTGAPARR
jgi:hypothetical protein